MSWADESAFIKKQLDDFHTFLDELWFFRGIADDIATKLEFELHNKVSVAFCTNFRDILWHYSSALEHETDEIETHTQYRMMLEHLNRAVIDLLIDTLQKLYHINRMIAFSCRESLKQDDLKVIFQQKERDHTEYRLLNSKNGYLLARRAIFMLRNRRGALSRPIASKCDYKSHEDCDNVSAYYIEVISLLTQCFEALELSRRRIYQ